MTTLLHPPGWPRASGHAHGVSARGRTVHVAGQIGCDPSGRLVAPELVPQARQALLNAVAIVAEAGGRPEHFVRLTWYLLDLREYAAQRADLGAAYRAVMGAWFPAMTAVQVAGLLEPGAQVEIEATAVIPDGGSIARSTFVR